MAINVVGVKAVVVDQVGVVDGGNRVHEQVHIHKGTVRFKAASAAGPGDVESRDVWVTLSLADLVVLLWALPAGWFDTSTWSAFMQVLKFMQRKSEERG
jgi:hypothetical protein